MVTDSWRTHPVYFAWQVGFAAGSGLIDDWVEENTGYFAGYRIGWDFDHYWGIESRFNFAAIELEDSDRAIAAQQQADSANGIQSDSSFGRRFERDRDATVFIWDVCLLYYPWGDAVWRPYFTVGLGTGHHRFQDRLSQVYGEPALELPIGIGLKYRRDSRMAFRAEVVDNISFHNEFNTVHDVSFTLGLEWHFGGRPVAYWPWNPSSNYW